MASRSLSRRRAPKTSAADLEAELSAIAGLRIEELRARWRERRREEPPAALSKDLIARALAYWMQEDQYGGLSPATARRLDRIGKSNRPVRWLKIGTIIVREHKGVLHEVVVTPAGFLWRGETYASLSAIALRITGTHWNGARFFGLHKEVRPAVPAGDPSP